MKSGRIATVSAAIAHVLAWAAFLWIAFWPHAYQGVSATPVQVDELGNPVGAVESEVVRHSASFIEVNGIGALLPLFIPALLTGVALMALLVWEGRHLRNRLILGGLAAVLLVFCGLGYLSFGILYLPAALALIIAAVAFSFGLRLPRVPQE